MPADYQKWQYHKPGQHAITKRNDLGISTPAYLQLDGMTLLKYSVKAPAGHNLPQNTGPKNKVTISKITIQAIKGSDISSNFHPVNALSECENKGYEWSAAATCP